MMKLFQLNATANWGSTGKIAEGIGLAALKNGWISYMAYGRSMNPSSSQLIKVGSKFDVYSHYAKHRFLNKEGFGSSRPTKKLIKQISEIKPDIIHLHNIHDHWLNFPIFFEYLNSIKTPIVWTFHDCWAFTGGCPHFVEYECNKWQSDCSNCPLKRNNSKRSSINLSNKTNSINSLGNRISIISVSNWLDSLVAKSHLSSLPHSVIYNGIDTNIFKPTDFTHIESKYHLQGKKVLLAVSNVWPESKGFRDYIKLRDLLDGKFQIILVGLTKELIAQLPSGIIGIERTSDLNELTALYTRADAVVSLSKAETFGLTLIEGQACGTPSIGYSSTAINEVISEESGIKVAPQNLQEVANAAKYICNSRPFSPDELRNSVITNFNSNNQFQKYIRLYSSLIL